MRAGDARHAHAEPGPPPPVPQDAQEPVGSRRPGSGHRKNGPGVQGRRTDAAALVRLTVGEAATLDRLRRTREEDPAARGRARTEQVVEVGPLAPVGERWPTSLAVRLGGPTREAALVRSTGGLERTIPAADDRRILRAAFTLARLRPPP